MVILFLVTCKVNMDDWQLSRSANIVVIVIIVLILAAIIVLLIVAFNSWNNDNSGSDDGGGGTTTEDGAISGGDLFPEAQKPPASSAPGGSAPAVSAPGGSAPAGSAAAAKPPAPNAAKPAPVSPTAAPKSAMKPASKPANRKSKAPEASGAFEDFTLKEFSLPSESIRIVADDEREPTTATDPDIRFMDGSADLSARVQLLLNREPMREMSLSSAKTPQFSSAKTPQFSDSGKKRSSSVPPELDESGDSVADRTSSPSTQELEADVPRVATRSKGSKGSLALGDILSHTRSSTSYVEEETSGQSISVPHSDPIDSDSEHPNVPSDFSSLTERPHKRPKDPVAALAKISKE